MENQKPQRTRVLAFVLTLTLLLSVLPSAVFATEGDTSINTIGLTECHEAHDADCGYREAAEGTICSHLNEDGSSSCTPVVSDDALATPETLDTGATCNHTDDCGYTEAVAAADCTHALSCDTLCAEKNKNDAVMNAETGLFAGRFSHYQVFDCWRDPAEPVANSPLKVHKFAVPFNDIADQGYQMTEDDVKDKIFYFRPTAVGENTVILYMADNVAGGNEQAISRAGGIYALGKEGFLFITLLPPYGSSKGYFISLSQGFNYGGELTYTPTEGGPISADMAASLPGVSSTPWNPNESWSVVFSSKDADKLATPSQISVRKYPAPAIIGTLPLSPERANYSFAGWNTQEDGNGTFINSKTELTDDITVYAQWRQREATSFKITTAPKAAYTYGDNFDPTGLVITVTYDDSSTQEIAYENNKSKFSFSLGTMDKLKINDDKVIITYTENGVPLSQDLTISVSQREVTPRVTGVADKEYDGTTATTNGSITLANTVAGDDVIVDYDSIAFATKDVGENKSVNVNNITLDGAEKENYVLSTGTLIDAATTAKITPLEATITWEPSPAIFTYDGTAQSVTATLSSNLLAGDDCTATVTNGSATLPGDYTATATLTNGNYVLKPENSTYQFTIAKATIAGIVVTPTEKVYDGIYENGVIVTGQLPTDVVLYSTDNGATWSNDVPQVGRAGSHTDIWVKVTREHHEPYSAQKVTATVKNAPAVNLEKPVFDVTDFKKVTVGGTVTQGDNPVTTQTFEIREMGGTVWTTLNAGTENGNVTTYSQLLDNLAGNTEYELRLTAIDSANATATTTLTFRTQSQNAATGGIIGSVDGGTGAGTITVTLEMGNTVVASIKGLSNKEEFSFTNLADGEYNVVATDASGRRVTMMASVKDGKTTRLSVLMIGQQQSAVEVKGNTPPVAVDGLQELFASDTYNGDAEAKDAIASNGTVEIRLTANEAKEQSEIDAIRARVGSDTIRLLIDLKVDMIITPFGDLTTVKNLKEVDGLLTVAVPLPADAIGKSNHKIYRHHNGMVEELRQIQSETEKTEGTFRIDGKYAYIYSSKFSTYAITYNDFTGGDDDSGNSSVTPPVVEESKTAITGVANLLVTDQHMKYMIGDEKGNFNPTSNMTRAEVAQMFYNLMRDKSAESTVRFHDVADSAWYAEAVNTLASMDILEGADGNFRPNDGITRAEFAAVAVRFSKMEEADCTFSDVDENLWSYGAIATASHYGWINGYEDNTFRPEQQILRAEVVVIVNNMLGRTPDKEYIDANKASLKIFEDAAATSDWSWYHIVEATNAHAHTFEQKEEKWTSLKSSIS